jgi:hypothetical protein
LEKEAKAMARLLEQAEKRKAKLLAQTGKA